MCGIAGMFSRGTQPADLRALEAMTQAQAHRGPDGEGYVLVDPDGHEKPLTVAGSVRRSVGDAPGRFRLGFGHRRLAIVDLTPLGRQPMGTEDGLVWITYNGEVYNAVELRRELGAQGHRFHSATDTEVVLEAYRRWGRSCLDRFNGMFAFAIWDGRDRSLFCARDRFGMKPFYYRLAGDRLLFASEIKAILHALPDRPRPNERILYDYLTLGRQDHTADTFFDGVQQLAPGEWLLVRESPGCQGFSVERQRWWHLPPGSERVNLPEAVAGTKELLQDSVRLELRADVPVGSCLSGGLDSSSLVCLMRRALPADVPLTSVSSCYEDARFDERPYIHAVLSATGAGNHQVFPDGAALFAELPAIIWHQDEPFAGTSVLAQWEVMKTAARIGLKALLDGQGADELLLGYPYFHGARLADLIKRGRWLAAFRGQAAWRREHGSLPPAAVATLAGGLLPATSVRTLRRWVVRDRDWLAPSFDRAWRDDTTNGPLERKAGDRSVLRARMERAVTEDLPALLHYEDRNAMAFSVEARLPFLDHRLVEWLAGLPADFKLRQGVTKVLLREAMAGILPEAVRLRSDKMGFVTPEDRWLRVELRPQIEAMLDSDSVRSRPYWRQAALKGWYRRYCDGQLAIGPVVWRWINLEGWLRRFHD